VFSSVTVVARKYCKAMDKKLHFLLKPYLGGNFFAALNAVWFLYFAHLNTTQ